MTQRLWRHQGVLALIGATLLVIATALVASSAEHTEPIRWLADGRPTYAVDVAAVRRLTWAVSAAGVATATALVFALVHVMRVLSLTFKGEGE